MSRGKNKMDPTTNSELTTFCGGITACLGGATYMTNESIVILIISALGALVGMLGLAYTIWNGERNFALAREEHEARMKNIKARSEDRGSR